MPSLQVPSLHVPSLHVSSLHLPSHHISEETAWEAYLTHWVTRPEISFETDTETFFWDQIFLRPIPRLFLETQIFETETDTLKKLRKVSKPRNLETRCHTLHRKQSDLKAIKARLKKELYVSSISYRGMFESRERILFRQGMYFLFQHYVKVVYLLLVRWGGVGPIHLERNRRRYFSSGP